MGPWRGVKGEQVLAEWCGGGVKTPPYDVED